jgi:mannose-1-phosphate guanylyltransferase/mannose-1-phosphate guanylyltransferase/mannose-6-phosphate isomerase
MFDECLIMAGGSGTRLWPASNSKLPKQFLPASEKSTFFYMALERAFAVTGKSGRVIVIAGKSHIPHVITNASKLNAAEKKRLLVISEPAAKNTAPAIACAVVNSRLCGGKNMLVLTSDHIIKPIKTFIDDAALAAAAIKEKNLAVFGIPPLRPETGYGYIETGKINEDGAYNVKAFHEKPDPQTAKKYAASRRFFWNSGMFAYNISFMANEMRLLAPDVFLPFEKLKIPKNSEYTISEGVKILNAWQGLEAAYRKALRISFDYAIAEKCKNTVMIRANFNWIDIGNWDEYAQLRGKNNSQIYGEKEASSCYVDSDIPVALAGVEDLIVVIRSGKNGNGACALITRKGQTQKVRNIVEQIKESGKNELL